MNSTEMTEKVVGDFFGSFANGDIGGVFAQLSENVEYTINARGTPTIEAIPWSTTFRGKVEVEAFFGRLMSNFDVLAFSVDAILAKDELAGVFGSFKYLAKQTGKECYTDWSGKIVVRNGKIVSYHFLEDSYAIARAFHIGGEWEIVVDGESRTVPV